jgi:ssDNA-binding replication factor A large subunit
MDYQDILQKIREKTNWPEEQVNQKITEKQKELSNLVSKEGAAYIIAKELGLDLFPKTKRRLEIRNVVPKIKSLDLSARIVRIFEPREFEKEGRKGKVANVILGDSTGSIRLSLWDDQTQIIESLKTGMAVETFGAYTKEDGMGGVEIRLSKKGGLKILQESDLPTIEELPKRTANAQRKSISNLKESEMCEIKAAVVQLFDSATFYEVCPTCGKRLIKEEKIFKCKIHGEVTAAYSMVVSGVVDDGTGNVRAVFFRNAAVQLTGMDIEKAREKGDSFLEDLDILGKEFILIGRARKNPMFNRIEFIVSEAKPVDPIFEANKILNSLLSNV